MLRLEYFCTTRLHSPPWRRPLDLFEKLFGLFVYVCVCVSVHARICVLIRVHWPRETLVTTIQ